MVGRADCSWCEFTSAVDRRWGWACGCGRGRGLDREVLRGAARGGRRGRRFVGARVTGAASSASRSVPRAGVRRSARGGAGVGAAWPRAATARRRGVAAGPNARASRRAAPDARASVRARAGCRSRRVTTQTVPAPSAAEAEADDRADRGDPAAAARAGRELGAGGDVAALEPVPERVELGLGVEQATRHGLGTARRRGWRRRHRGAARPGRRSARVLRVDADPASAKRPVTQRSGASRTGIGQRAARRPRRVACSRRTVARQAGQLRMCGRSSSRASALAVPAASAARVGAKRSHSAPASISA